jgi:hypothetical protein
VEKAVTALVGRHGLETERLLEFAGNATAADEYRRRRNRLEMARKIKKFLSVPKFTTRARGPARYGLPDTLELIRPSYPAMPAYLRQLAGLRSWVMARSIDWGSVSGRVYRRDL